jgi:hypothetical protein
MNDRAEARSWYRSTSTSVNLKTSMRCCEGTQPQSQRFISFYRTASCARFLHHFHLITRFGGDSMMFSRGMPGFPTALRHVFELSVSRRLLQISSLICALIIPQLIGDGEMLFRLLRAAKTLVRFT